MIKRGGSAWRCAPTITWVKDAGQTLLVDEERGRCWTLRGRTATIWDLLTLGYPFEKVSEFLALLQASSDAEAEEAVATTVRAWQQAGILQTVEGT